MTLTGSDLQSSSGWKPTGEKQNTNNIGQTFLKALFNFRQYCKLFIFQVIQVPKSRAMVYLLGKVH